MKMISRRLPWLVCCLAGCVCGPGPQPDGGVLPIDAGLDAGVSRDAGGDEDAGVVRDAGSVDAGDPRDSGVEVDAGFDGGADAGRVDGGFDAGRLPECAPVVCPPWQHCVETNSGPNCVGATTITWVSPSAGSSAPADLQSIPLAIDTDTDSTVEVPWSSSGVLISAGTFSGQMGIRAATLFLADTDAGVVTLTAGWDGGPSASVQLTLTPRIVHVPPPPSYGTNGPDFEPNDPTGNAFRRDDVVPVVLDDLPQPMAVFAKLEAANAKTSAFAVTQRCDGGNCWVVDVSLRELDFPAFRGRVLIWASGADGGLQTMPHAVPVTRWRWRRQVSGVPNPVSVTRPFVATVGGPNDKLFVGSSDTATTGRFMHLKPNGEIYHLGRGPVGAAKFAGAYVSSVNTPDGGVMTYMNSSGVWSVSHPGRVTACVGTINGTLRGTVCGFEGNILERDNVTSFFSIDSGCPIREESALVATWDHHILIVTEGLPICAVEWPGEPPVQPISTMGAYHRAFAASFGASYELDLLAAGLDGGLWRIFGGPSSEALVWPGDTVDGVAMGVRSSTDLAKWAYWATADRRVHAASTSSFQNEQVAAQLLPDRLATTPVLAFGYPNDGGSAVFVSRSGAISAYDRQQFTRTWVLEAGDGGVRGGRVDTDPIMHHYCGQFASLLVPSSGDGSLYSFVLDHVLLSPIYWPMGGGTPDVTLTSNSLGCISD